MPWEPHVLGHRHAGPGQRDAGGAVVVAAASSSYRRRRRRRVKVVGRRFRRRRRRRRERHLHMVVIFAMYVSVYQHLLG